MNITLIKPNIGRMEHSLYVDEGRMEPLQLGVLASLVPEEDEVLVYDDRMEAIPYDTPTDLVSITVETYTARRAYEIAAEYRRRGVPVILGGMHVTLLPGEAAQYADAIFIGDAEFGFREAIEDARAGRLKSRYEARTGIPQENGRLFPRRDLFRKKGYLPITLMQFGRGCHHACTFCAVSAYFGREHHYRSIDTVVAEIAAQPRKTVFFVDDNLLANRKAAKQLFRELIPLKIRWLSQGTIDMTRDLELMDLMARSGCLGLVAGFESLEAESLRGMKKPGNFSGFDVYQEAIEIVRDHGLQLWAAFTLGHDHDTVDTVKRTVDFAIDHKFCFAAFNILMPYPNTPLYRRLAGEGRLLYDGTWWLHPEYRFNHAAFQPARMSPDELTEACFAARARFNSIPSIVKRAFDWKTNMRNPLRLALYLTYNPLVRREVHKKQGMQFGLGDS
jgi:radical SAM superfamily enzyme YgiQ (UPF0313 family)